VYTNKPTTALGSYCIPHEITGWASHNPLVAPCVRGNEIYLGNYYSLLAKSCVDQGWNRRPAVVSLPEKRPFVPVCNPHLYRLLNRYKPSGTNEGGTFVPGEIPSTNAYSPSCPSVCSIPSVPVISPVRPLHFFFLFSFSFSFPTSQSRISHHTFSNHQESKTKIT
jgi:hypothetical protein